MNAKNQGWYDANAGRAYPLDDRATHEDDAGASLPQDLLLDASIRFPAELGDYLFLGAIAATPNLWTATLLACASIDSPPSEFVPVAAVYRTSEWRPEDACELTPLFPGVAGWLVIGGDRNAAYRGKFSTPTQALLLPRVARPYQPSGVSSVSREGAAVRLTGMVKLKGGNDVEVVGADRVVEGVSRRVIVVRLKEATAEKEPLDLYRGPCGDRPESGTCETVGIEFLNEVGPDCNGNIELIFPDIVDLVPFAEGGGLEVNYPLGLAHACTNKDTLPDAEGRLPNDYDDTCTPQFEGYESSAGPLPESDPTSHDIPGDDVPDPTPPPLPYVEDFDDSIANDWEVLEGNFGLVSGDSAETSASSGTGNQAYSATDPTARSVSILNNYSYAETTSKGVSTDVRVRAGGAHGAAGLVLNYHTVIHTVAVDEYIAVDADVANGSLRIRLWSGAGFLGLGAVGGLDLRYGDWYQVSATVSAPDGDGRVVISASLFGLTRPGVSASLTIGTYRYTPGDGRFGVGADGTLADFATFRVEAA